LQDWKAQMLQIIRKKCGNNFYKCFADSS